MKKDIENRDDIRILVDDFYQKLLDSKPLSYLFTDVAQIRLDEHLPVIYDFWESALFQTGSYQGKTMDKHLELHMASNLTEAHFIEWTRLFNESVDAHFEGEKATMAKKKAFSIATIIKLKIEQLERIKQEINN